MSESRHDSGCLSSICAFVIFLGVIILLISCVNAIDNRLDRLEERSGIVSCDEEPRGLFKWVHPIAERDIKECD